MPIGDYGNNNSDNRSGKAYEATIYSRVRYNSNNGTNKRLNIYYRAGLMCIEINNILDGFKAEATIGIFLSPTKAGMLVNEIDRFLEYRNGDELDPNKGFGINAGMNEKITFCAFSTNANRDIILTIGKFNGSGTITESDQFTFAVDYNYSLEWNDLKANDLAKVYHNDADITTLRNTIADFARAMSGAFAYSVVDGNRYNEAHMNNRLDKVFDKLGIERQYSNGGGRSFGSNNFLNNSSSKSTSFEEVEDLLD